MAVFLIIRHRWNRMRIVTAIHHGLGERIGHDTEQLLTPASAVAASAFAFLI